MPLIDQDYRLLRAICDRTLARDSAVLEQSDVSAVEEAAGLSAEALDESLNVLVHRRLLETQTSIDGTLLWVSPTATGFDAYAVRYLGDYRTLLARAAQWLHANRSEWPTNLELASALAVPTVLADHLLQVFLSRGWLRLGAKDFGGSMPAYDLSMELGRITEDDGGTPARKDGSQ
jgi:hypothetical protein